LWVNFNALLGGSLFSSGLLDWLCLFNWLGIGIHLDELAHDRRFYG
jgi:hypothetical protein